MLFASDFGQLIPWWFHLLFAIIVAIPLLAVVGGILVVLVRIVKRTDRDKPDE